MTHDELLAKIKGSSPHWKALRAAVEIHKPFDSGVCGCEIDSITISYTYPCPTIQAIEKELT